MLQRRFTEPQFATKAALAQKVAKAGDTMTGDLVGTDFVKTRTIGITRDVNGYITEIAKTGGRTITITRDVSNYITSYTDSINTWTMTRDLSNYITAITVT